MGTPWESESDETEQCWSDREAWRGDQYVERFDLNRWRERGEIGWVWAEPEVTEDDNWPEHLAGPEYWLYKKYGT